MIARGVTEQQILDAAAEVNVRVYYLREEWKHRRSRDFVESYASGYRFTLKTGAKDDSGERPYKAPYRRFSHNRYGTLTTIPGAVCWHGHRDFFRALYRRAPAAWIKTALATYTSAEQFERAFPATEYQPAQRMGFPLDTPGALCSCEKD